MVSEPSLFFLGGYVYEFSSNLINFGLSFSKKIMSFNKYDSEPRPVIGWLSVRRADKDVSRGAGPQSSSRRFSSVHHY